MVLVTGVTGSGKSSTMAAMVNYINANMSKHIVTLENPIEFLHSDIQSSMTPARDRRRHGELQHGSARRAAAGSRTSSMIGEMRDAETIDTAMKAAETGHLVLTHAAHAGRAEHDHAHHGDVPAGGAGGRADASRRVAARRRVAAPAAARGREGARGGGRDHDRHAARPRHDHRRASASARFATTSPRGATSTACRRSTSTWPIWSARGRSRTRWRMPRRRGRGTSR